MHNVPNMQKVLNIVITQQPNFARTICAMNMHSTDTAYELQCGSTDEYSDVYRDVRGIFN